MNKKETVPIVIVAFNRPRSLRRLLKSLAKAKYPSKDIPLIISIDKSETNGDVLTIAEQFQWNFGLKEIRYQKKNLGLRKHIIKCGTISSEYGYVIMLEDDLYVAAHFYFFAVQALEFGKNKPYVGGISLYNHLLNQHTYGSFSHLEDGYDNWYFQYAASWGQAWSKEHFENFHEWYLQNQELIEKPQIPKNITNWSDRSWLKFFMVFLVEKNRYFIYPKVSYTTNFSDSGTHITNDSTTFQVPLSYSDKTKFKFSNIEESQSVYDVFYENVKLADVLNLKREDLCVDLYGIKTNHRAKKFYLTSKILDYEIRNSFARSLRPIDLNIVENIDGKDLFLYDTTKKIKNTVQRNKMRELIYTFKGITYQEAIRLAIELTKKRLKLLIFNR